jgi:DNA polymerase
MARSQQSLFDAGSEPRFKTLDELNREMARGVSELPEFKDKVIIPGEGRTGSRVAVVGESPGPPDIPSGKPFMGPAGDMLERMLGAINLRRDQCYLTNVVKLVTTGDEITKQYLSFFGPFLRDELKLVMPELIISFGNTATRTLLETKEPITHLRGQFHEFEGIKLMPTFNPAYLLRDPTRKREAWEDLKKVRDALNAASR